MDGRRKEKMSSKDEENNLDNNAIDDNEVSDSPSENEAQSGMSDTDSSQILEDLATTPEESKEKRDKFRVEDLNNNNSFPPTQDIIVGFSIFSRKSDKKSHSSTEGGNQADDQAPRGSKGSKSGSILKKTSGQYDGRKTSSKKVSLEENKAKALVSKPEPKPSKSKASVSKPEPEPSKSPDAPAPSPDPDSQPPDAPEETNEETTETKPPEASAEPALAESDGPPQKQEGQDGKKHSRRIGDCLSKLDCFNWRCFVCWGCVAIGAGMFVYLLLHKCVEVPLFAKEKPMSDVSSIVILTYFMTGFVIVVSFCFIIFIKLRASRPCWTLVARIIIIVFLTTGFIISYTEYKVKRLVPAPPEFNFTSIHIKEKPTTPKPTNSDSSSNSANSSNSSLIVTKTVYECLIDCQTFTFAMLVLGAIPYIVFILVHRKNRKIRVASEAAHVREEEEEQEQEGEGEEEDAESGTKKRRSFASQGSLADETETEPTKKRRSRGSRSSNSSRGSASGEADPTGKRKSSRRRSFFEKRRSSDRGRSSKEFSPLVRKSLIPPSSPRSSKSYGSISQGGRRSRRSSSGSRRGSFFENRRSSGGGRNSSEFPPQFPVFPRRSLLPPTSPRMASNPYENPNQEISQPRRSSDRRGSFYEQRRDSLPQERPSTTMSRASHQENRSRSSSSRRSSVYERRNSK